MYSVYFYGQMLADTPRLRAYVEALKRSVKPGAVVLDLGCGPGFFALLACQLGARRVYAVEPDDVIQIAHDAATANGYTDKIDFFQSFSQGDLTEDLQFAIGEQFVRSARCLASKSRCECLGQARCDITSAGKSLSDRHNQFGAGTLLGHISSGP